MKCEKQSREIQLSYINKSQPKNLGETDLILGEVPDLDKIIIKKAGDVLGQKKLKVRDQGVDLKVEWSLSLVWWTSSLLLKHLLKKCSIDMEILCNSRRKICAQNHKLSHRHMTPIIAWDQLLGVLTLPGIVSLDSEALAKAQPARVVQVAGIEASVILFWDPNRNHSTTKIFLTTDRQQEPIKFKCNKKEEWAAWEKGEFEFELIMLRFNH